MLTVYVLKLQNNKYYIGKTYKNIYDRVLEHSSGNGAIWTKIHKPLLLEYFKFNADKFDEDYLVKKYMDKYGINNVRGGTYGTPYLSREQYNHIFKEINHANNKHFTHTQNYVSKNKQNKQNNSNDNNIFGSIYNYFFQFIV